MKKDYIAITIEPEKKELEDFLSADNSTLHTTALKKNQQALTLDDVLVENESNDIAPLPTWDEILAEKNETQGLMTNDLWKNEIFPKLTSDNLGFVALSSREYLKLVLSFLNNDQELLAMVIQSHLVTGKLNLIQHLLDGITAMSNKEEEKKNTPLKKSTWSTLTRLSF